MVEQSQSIESIQISYKEFPETLQQYLSKYPKILLIFSGSINQQTKQSWCSDCQAAEPLIQEFVLPKAKENSLPIIQCNVGEKEEWKSDQHPLRSNKFVKLKAIPTIMEITKAGIQKKIEEEDCKEKSIVELLFK